MPPAADRAGFPVTRWSVVLRASANDERGRLALGELCSSYWHPLYAFARRRGSSRSDAEDLVQGFLAQVLDKDALAGVDRERGRFRAYLLGAFKHYVAKQARRAHALKRGGAAAPLSLDFDEAEGLVARQLPDDRTPEAAYAHAWAMTVLRRAEDRVRQAHEQRGQGPVFEALRGFLLGGQTPRYRDVAHGLGTTEGAARVAAHRLRTQFRRTLREEVAQTLVEGADVDEELRALMDALRGAGSQ